MSQRCKIIAEAGVNHNGSATLAHQLVDAAAEARADVVKFQTFSTELIVTRDAAKAPYQQTTTGAAESQFDMIKKLELPASVFAELATHARERGIEFMSTPFDLPSLEILISLGVSTLKVPSGELTNPILLEAAARTQLPIILSTGMGTLGEVEAALAVLAEGYSGGRAALRDKVTILHCTTDYPARDEAVNLSAMETLRRAFGLRVGYSDHTTGTTIAFAARALGATVIEKHFTLDRSLPGPDHHASLTPTELAELVTGVRRIEQALGDGVKAPQPSELPNRAVARKSLVAAHAIKRGEPFTRDNLTAKRPGTGVSPMRIAEYVGKPATRDYQPDEMID